ncbi:MAG TPA: hypothetical protein VJ986_10795, partial [Gaiellaceae bacterium]|nr:hypothetical protein [Gaiellaceae bacterium]
MEAHAVLPSLADELEAELIDRARTRMRSALAGRDGILALGFASVFLTAAICAAVMLPPVRAFSPLVALVALVVLALVSSVEFEVGNGFVHAAELVLVPMLFVLPPRVVPLVVAAAFLVRHLPSLVRGKLQPSHLPVALFNASYALGPAVVIALAGDAPAGWSRLPLYAAALAAQFAGDFVVGGAWSRFAWRVPWREHAQSMRISLFIDGSLAPVGLTVAIATGDSAWGLLAALP